MSSEIDLKKNEDKPKKRVVNISFTDLMSMKQKGLEELLLSDASVYLLSSRILPIKLTIVELE